MRVFGADAQCRPTWATSSIFASMPSCAAKVHASTQIVVLLSLGLLAVGCGMVPGSSTLVQNGRKVTNIVRDVVGGVVAMPALLSAVVLVGASSDTKDPVGAVCSRVPRFVAESLVRDSRLAWRIFTAFEAGGAAAAYVLTRAELSQTSLWTAARTLTSAYAAAQPKRRIQVSDTCAIELFGNATSAVLFAPGGAWSHADDARLYRLLAANMVAALDVAVAVVEYKAYPVSTGAGMVNDVALAMEWVSETFDSVVVLGHSAGAQLISAALLTRRVDLEAAVLMSGPYDLEAHIDFESRRGVVTVSALSAAFATREERHSFSPSRIARARSKAPTLPRRLALIHGALDTTVPLQSTTEFDRALSDICSIDGRPLSKKLYILPNKDHFDYLFEAFLSCDAPIFDLLRLYCKPSSPNLDRTKTAHREANGISIDTRSVAEVSSS